MTVTVTWQWQWLDEFAPRQLFDYLFLRQDVFVIEQEAFPDLDDYDIESLHLTGYTDSGELIAAGRLVPPGIKKPDPSLGRIVLLKSHRGEGLGHELVDNLLRKSAALWPDRGHQIGAQSQLQPFYAKHGFRPLGDEYDEVGIAHINMVMTADDMQKYREI